MSLTRRTLLRGLPLLLALPRLVRAQETWVAAVHPLNDPRTCLGWWLTTPLSGTVTWRDLIHQQGATLTSMALLSSATSGLQRRTTRVGGWGHVACDGVDDHVVLGDLLNGALTLSLALWLRTTYAETTSAGIVTRRDAATDTGWYMSMYQAGKFTFYLRQGSVWRGKDSTVTVNDDRWHHLAATLEGGADGTTTLYLDGRVHPGLQQNNGSLPIDYTNAVPVQIAQHPGASVYFPGAVDDLRLYNRALTARDVAQLYQEARLGYPTLLAPGPQVAYTLPPTLPLRPLPSLLFRQ